jgi:acetone carboxylase gamma subunit
MAEKNTGTYREYGHPKLGPLREGEGECPHLLLTDFKANVRHIWKMGAVRDWLCPDCGKFVKVEI